MLLTPRPSGRNPPLRFPPVSDKRYPRSILYEGDVRMKGTRMLEGTRILIVDDEADTGEILSLRLGRRGLKPSYAASGEAALEHLKSEQTDIVLLDIKMPGMDGLEVLEHIRRDHPKVKVIILSGHADMEAAARGMELGAFFYLLKPVNFDELCHKIEDACRQRELEQPAG